MARTLKDIESDIARREHERHIFANSYARATILHALRNLERERADVLEAERDKWKEVANGLACDKCFEFGDCDSTCNPFTCPETICENAMKKLKNKIDEIAETKEEQAAIKEAANNG